MKKIFIPLLLITLLFSCSKGNRNVNTSSNSNVEGSSNYEITSSRQEESSSSLKQSENSSQKENSESKSTSSSQSESKSTSKNEEIIETIAIIDAKEKSLALKDNVNEVDVAVSTEMVQIKGTLLSRNDAVTTKKGYGNRYKLFIVDTTSYIYVQVDYKVYAKLENSIGKTYLFKGNPSLYCKEPELVLDSYEEINSFAVDLSTISVPFSSVNDIHQQEKTLPTNCKGIAFSSLISIDLTYIGVHDNKVLLFSDGKDLILVHTRDKIKNSLSINSSYHLYATLSMYYYRPGLEYISHENIEQIDISTLKSNAHDITSQELYSTKIYNKDNDKSNMFYNEYSSRYQYLYHYKGYLDYYMVNQNVYCVLTDNLIEHQTIWTKENAINNKALFIVNSNYYNISESYFANSKYYQDYLNGTQIDIYFSLDLYNTGKYFQVYLY